MEWKLAEAKNRLSEVINKAALEGPQRVVRRNDAFIIMEEALYQQLTGRRASLKDHLMQGESLEGLDLSRDKTAMRDAEI